MCSIENDTWLGFSHVEKETIGVYCLEVYDCVHYAYNNLLHILCAELVIFTAMNV